MRRWLAAPRMQLVPDMQGAWFSGASLIDCQVSVSSQDQQHTTMKLGKACCCRLSVDVGIFWVNSACCSPECTAEHVQSNLVGWDNDTTWFPGQLLLGFLLASQQHVRNIETALAHEPPVKCFLGSEQQQV